LTKVIFKNFNCPECDGNEFSLDKNRNHYTNKEKTKGYWISTRTCLNCGWKQTFNRIGWRTQK